VATKSFVTFHIDQQMFGIEIERVREINRYLDITQVQQAPSYIRGLVNLRGQIVTVLDLGIRLGLAAREITSKSHNVILNALSSHNGDEARESRDTVGLLVDAIDDVVEVEENEIEPPPANIGELDGRFLTGVAKLNEGLLVILSGEKVLEKK